MKRIRSVRPCSNAADLHFHQLMRKLGRLGASGLGGRMAPIEVQSQKTKL